MHTLTGGVVTALILLTLGYRLWIAVRPFKTCRTCHGFGRQARRIGPPKPCRKCNGTGLRGRASRKAARAARNTWRQARR